MPVELLPHPNADALSIVRVFGYQVVVRTEDWQGVALGAYIPPDSVVPDTEQFAFLEGKRRIKARRLRGEWSMGLLVPAPGGSQVGDDVAEQLGVTHYEPPLKAVRGARVSFGPQDVEAPPSGLSVPKYDLEALRRYSAVFRPGEPVFVTEKLHGTQGRYVFAENRMWVSSRNFFRKPDEANLYWKVLTLRPEVEKFCRENPGYVVYGEIYGAVQDLDYGLGPEGVDFAVFDILSPEGRWLDSEEARRLAHYLPWVPAFPVMFFDPEGIWELAEGPSLIPGAQHVREGVVVKPLKERWDSRVGRVALKLVGNGYYARKEAA